MSSARSARAGATSAQHLDYERLGLAASYVGNARTALDDTIAYTKNRIAFGRPLSSLQVLKHRMAEDETALTAARLLVFNAATKMLRGEKASKEVSMAKVFAAETAFRIAFNGMQAYGGYAQLPEYDMERYFREAKHGMVGGGANEIQKTVIARHMGLSDELAPARAGASRTSPSATQILTGGRTVEPGGHQPVRRADGRPLSACTSTRSTAESTRFGERIAHGPLTFSIAVGLVGLSGWYGDVHRGAPGVPHPCARPRRCAPATRCGCGPPSWKPRPHEPAARRAARRATT